MQDQLDAASCSDSDSVTEFGGITAVLAGGAMRSRQGWGVLIGKEELKKEAGEADWNEV